MTEFYPRNVSTPLYRAATMTALLAMSLLTLPAAAGAQDRPVEKEVQDYRLTMPKVQQLATVFKTLAALKAKAPESALTKAQAELDRLQAKEDPTNAELTRIEALQDQIEKLEEGEDDADLSGAETVADMARLIDRHPQFAAAVRQSGMTTREFATAQLAYLQAAMAFGLQKSGMLKTLPAGVNVENVKFLAAHEAELTALFAGLEKKR